MENINYADLFTLERGEVLSFPNFSMQYIGKYQDVVPERFPNKKSGLFRGDEFTIKSSQEEKKLKVSEGSGIISNIRFEVDGQPYSYCYVKSNEGNILRNTIIKGEIRSHPVLEERELLGFKQP